MTRRKVRWFGGKRTTTCTDSTKFEKPHGAKWLVIGRGEAGNSEEMGSFWDIQCSRNRRYSEDVLLFWSSRSRTSELNFVWWRSAIICTSNSGLQTLASDLLKSHQSVRCRTLTELELWEQDFWVSFSNLRWNFKLSSANGFRSRYYIQCSSRNCIFSRTRLQIRTK